MDNVIVHLWNFLFMEKAMHCNSVCNKEREGKKKQFTDHHLMIVLLLCFQKFWDWSWQELALYDFPGMANYVSSVTNSTIFVVGHSQVSSPTEI